jgi:hypothetical protein
LIQDVQIKRGWNAFSPAGSTGLTLNRVIMWGFPNHALGMGGYNQTIRNSIVFNSQESFYSQGLPSPTTPLVNFVMENNFFPDKVLFRGASNSNMTIRYNIFTQVAADTDNMAGPFAAVDCNIYFKMPSADVWEVDGASPNYETLADLKAATTFEDHGAELTEADLSNGTQFVLFAKPYVETYDLHPAGELSQSVNMPAACGSYVGPSTSSTPSAPPAPAPPSAPLLKTLIRTRPAEIGMTATASRRVEPRQPHHSPF